MPVFKEKIAFKVVQAFKRIMNILPNHKAVLFSLRSPHELLVKWKGCLENIFSQNSINYFEYFTVFSFITILDIFAKLFKKILKSKKQDKVYTQTFLNTKFIIIYKLYLVFTFKYVLLYFLTSILVLLCQQEYWQ